MSAKFKKATPTGNASAHIKAASVDPARAPLPAKAGAESDRLTLPVDGYTRWAELKHIVPCSHEWVRQRELVGRFPKRVQLGGPRCVGWSNRELLRWMESPNDYHAPGAPGLPADAQGNPPATPPKARKRTAVALATGAEG
ncbi:helix-turn-helix transcriptional regulator [Paraburkholderia adhaesiva]|uniref:helix-turn-helix transcriptional regulator n=1 Tax=Paraburkholderia adhaesiva TaxID=2883244 RepID=UPI001F2651D3|nr:AlpA family phage regulatory protein [Paraburkholderia adhaesiva]